MKPYRRLIIAGILLLNLLTFESCEKKEIKSSSDAGKYNFDKPVYVLHIKNGTLSGSDSLDASNADKTIIGNTIEANWDEELGLIWLGTDSELDPIATITMEIKGYNDVTNYSTATEVYISTTDKRVGTSSELNPKLYYAAFCDVYRAVVGGNFFKGEIINHEFTELNSNEKVTISCYFVAMDR